MPLKTYMYCTPLRERRWAGSRHPAGRAVADRVCPGFCTQGDPSWPDPPSVAVLRPPARRMPSQSSVRGTPSAPGAVPRVPDASAPSVAAAAPTSPGGVRPQQAWLRFLGPGTHSESDRDRLPHHQRPLPPIAAQPEQAIITLVGGLQPGAQPLLRHPLPDERQPQPRHRHRQH